nr:helicase C-terminal domain-containing protein [Pseudactinotalea sp. HY160]
MQTLIEAAGGRAIVLSATSSAGRFYVEALRRRSRGRWQVHSQWDGRGKEHTTRAWRADETSVLVGTRSYMTGVDAPGRTCSLVIVDRVPRGAANVVDDARVDVLAQDMNEFRARDQVYAVDAAQLLEQAAGRLIRSTSDRGVVAVLDPRLLKKQPVSYPGSTRSIYMGALEHFTSRTARLSVATDYLNSLCADPMDTPKAA